VLLQEAAYRVTPKSERADLHERLAARLEASDELCGHHLERAYRLRVELGSGGPATERLALEGGRRLGEAGVKALKRGDTAATVTLLRRATSLLPPDDVGRHELLCELGIALRTTGDAGAAAQVLASVEASEPRIALRARIELEYVRLLSERGRTADELVAVATDAIPLLEAAGDDRSLGRAWLLLGFAQGGFRGLSAAREQAAERAIVHYRRSGWPTSTCLGELAAALYFGPTPVPAAIERCERLLVEEQPDRAGEANLLVFLGGFEAQRGRFERARELIAQARAIYEDLGQATAAAAACDTILARVELVAGDAARAAAVLRELCDWLRRTHESAHLASAAADLADALYVDGRLAEAEEWARVSAAHAGADDVDAQLACRAVEAKLAARGRDLERAIELADEAARLVDATDNLNAQAKLRLDRAEILDLAGRADESGALLEEGALLYERKGNGVAAARARALAERREPARAGPLSSTT
jgi:tetratricopeptide (TPR) repeat protein